MAGFRLVAGTRGGKGGFRETIPYTRPIRLEEMHMPAVTKAVVVPVDGSKNALRSLDYLHLLLSGDQRLKILLFHVQPALPLIFENDKSLTKHDRARIREIKRKNLAMAEKVLAEAQAALLKKGFGQEQVEIFHQPRQQSVPTDIATYATHKKADAIAIGRRGRTDAKSLFLGDVSSKLVECSKAYPLWVVDGPIRSRKVLICLDASENALRAVDHAGFMLAGSDCPVLLFHSLKDLRGFVPRAIYADAPEIAALWQSKAGQQIAPIATKAEEILVQHGLSKKQISHRVVKGTRAIDQDILRTAHRGEFGTIVMGRRGLTGMQEFFMGSVSRKVLRQATGIAVWIVQ
jgi:nucleotide-binding universal stress UspA family protein